MILQGFSGVLEAAWRLQQRSVGPAFWRGIGSGSLPTHFERQRSPARGDPRRVSLRPDVGVSPADSPAHRPPGSKPVAGARSDADLRVVALQGAARSCIGREDRRHRRGGGTRRQQRTRAAVSSPRLAFCEQSASPSSRGLRILSKHPRVTRGDPQECDGGAAADARESPSPAAHRSERRAPCARARARGSAARGPRSSHAQPGPAVRLPGRTERRCAPGLAPVQRWNA